LFNLLEPPDVQLCIALVCCPCDAWVELQSAMDGWTTRWRMSKILSALDGQTTRRCMARITVDHGWTNYTATHGQYYRRSQTT